MAGYRLTRQDISVNEVTKIDVGTSTSYRDSGAISGHWYWYKVVAYDEAGNNTPWMSVGVVLMP